jgi:hypothetical protein
MFKNSCQYRKIIKNEECVRIWKSSWPVGRNWLASKVKLSGTRHAGSKGERGIASIYS